MTRALAIYNAGSNGPTLVDSGRLDYVDRIAEWAEQVKADRNRRDTR